MSSARRNAEKKAEWEARDIAEREERWRVANLSIFELLNESDVNEHVRTVIERICDHIGLDVYASPN